MSGTGLCRAFAVLLWVAAGGAAATGAGPVIPASAQAGDLVFREGTEAVSDAVLALDGGPFSHVGMLIGGPGNWRVIHATPAELPGRTDGVVVDALAFFLDRSRARQYAVYQVKADGDQRRAAVRAAQDKVGLPFRVADVGGTYCTRLVWDAWRQAGVDLNVRFTPLRLPLLAGEYLFPRALRASPMLVPLTGVEDVPARWAVVSPLDATERLPGTASPPQPSNP